MVIETRKPDRYKTLLLSYEGQKPPKPEFHDARSLALGKCGGGFDRRHDNDCEGIQVWPLAVRAVEHWR